MHQKNKTKKRDHRAPRLHLKVKIIICKIQERKKDPLMMIPPKPRLPTSKKRKDKVPSDMYKSYFKGEEDDDVQTRRNSINEKEGMQHNKSYM